MLGHDKPSAGPDWLRCKCGRHHRLGPTPEIFIGRLVACGTCGVTMRLLGPPPVLPPGKDAFLMPASELIH